MCDASVMTGVCANLAVLYVIQLYMTGFTLEPAHPNHVVLRGYNVVQSRWGRPELRPQECIDCYSDPKLQVLSLVQVWIALTDKSAGVSLCSSAKSACRG